MLTAPTTAISRDAIVAPKMRPAPGKANLDFARLVGEGWGRLPRDIRERFGEKPLAARPIRYIGVMSTVACSPAGLALAQLCRLFGTPFAPWRGRDVPTTISLRGARRGCRDLGSRISLSRR